MSKEHIVRSTLDFDNPPRLTPEQLEELRALSLLPDSEIDFSDIPPLDVSTMIPMDQRHMFRKRKKVLVP